MPPATSSATPQSPGAEERPAHLSEGHLYLRVPAEVELGNRFSALQNLHWRQLLGLRLLRRGEKLRQEKGSRRRERGCERTGDRHSSSGRKGSWPGPSLGKGAAVPGRRSAGRCPPGRGARLRTSSDRSACRCKQCLPSAEEAPC